MILRAGMRLPDAELAEVVGDHFHSFSLQQTIDRHPTLIIGVPGPFTPVCTHHHLPRIFAEVGQLERSGIKHFFVLCNSNPWAMARWKDTFPQAEGFRFVSDGNAHWLRRCGLVQVEHRMHLGECCARFTLIVNGGDVTRIRVESAPMELTCTSAEHILDDVQTAA